MTNAVDDVLSQVDSKIDDVDILIPHQANLRIIQAIQSKVALPDESVMVNIDKYGNTSAATIPIALCEAVEQGLIKPNSNMISAAFGAGLTWAASFIQWGDRVTPIKAPTHSLSETDKTGLELIQTAVENCR
jgi:3-oxoacyl-[acyl-carrier-protein] synthase-3